MALATRFNPRTAAVALGLALGTALPAAALAADMLEGGPAASSRQRVEYGTGWYLRGDIGYTDHNIWAERETAILNPATQAPIATYSETSDVISLGLGAGYMLSPDFRIDGTLEYMASGDSTTSETLDPPAPPCTNAIQFIDGNPFPTTITNCRTDSTQSYELIALMANAYYDLPINLGGLRPFIGAGAGLIRNEYIASLGNVTCTAAQDQRCAPTDGGAVEQGDTYTQEGVRTNGVSYHGAGSITAGFAYRMSQNLWLDASYRYLKMFDKPLYDGNSAVEQIDMPTDFHSVKLGLRVELW